MCFGPLGPMEKYPLPEVIKKLDCSGLYNQNVGCSSCHSNANPYVNRCRFVLLWMLSATAVASLLPEEP